MSKKSANFYVKDSLVLRIIMIVSIVSIIPIQILWDFFISSYDYHMIIGIIDILNKILTLSVVVIFFFPMDKHWKKYAIIFGSWFTASSFLTVINTVLQSTILIMILSIVMCIFIPNIISVSSFLLLTGKKPFKYIYIVSLIPKLLSSFISIIYIFTQFLEKGGLRYIFDASNPIEIIFSFFMDMFCEISPLLLAMLVFGFCIKTNEKKVGKTPLVTAPTENNISEVTPKETDIPVKEVVSVEQQIPVDISPKKVNIENTPTEYIYCAHCGAKGLTNTTFCTKCGQPHIIID